MIDGQTVLVTGGTGSFGKKFVENALSKHSPKRIIVFSRDELKQHDMQQELKDERVRFLLGDVRDRDRLRRAAEGAEIIVHAAALKHVPACEYNPFEAVMTNVIGTQNVADVAIDVGVEKAVALSTDKAVSPANLYGATKLCAEKLFVQSNVYAGSRPTRLSCVRYGNVVASRGSVIPAFLEQAKSGGLTITDIRMTRFWISLPQAVQFVADCIAAMKGGEVFIPKIPSMKISDLAAAVAPGVPIEVTGIRAGEKLHECLLTAHEARHSMDCDDHYIIEPEHDFWSSRPGSGTRLADGFEYSSDTNDSWIGVSELKALAEVAGTEHEPRRQ
jgi:UDP-N-acetylglucosamine 4,6-dehydratase (inverting)